MKKVTAFVLVSLFVIAAGAAAAIALATPADAGPTCWQVDCNTCCRVKGGGVVCTQRACV